MLFRSLNFMGNEFGQLREWTEKQEQDWDVLKYPIHDAFHHYMKELNRIYKASAALHDDYDPDNFRWLDCHQEERCIYAIGRKKEGEMLAAVFNFSDQEQKDYELEIEDTWKEECILNTDWDCWGGETPREKKTWKLEPETEKTTMSITLAPYSGVLFELRKTKPRKAKKTNKTKK